MYWSKSIFGNDDIISSSIAADGEKNIPSLLLSIGALSYAGIVILSPNFNTGFPTLSILSSASILNFFADFELGP